MEKLGDSIEFLCLSCGLQGLCSGCPGSRGGEVLCPKCGGRVVTTFPCREKASLVLTV